MSEVEAAIESAPQRGGDGPPATPASRLRFFPAIDWIRGYRLSSFPADLVAGFTLAAYVLPSALGNASLANLAPQAGLYAVLFGGLVYWAFCSSRHTAVAVTSAISMLVGASLGDFVEQHRAALGAIAAGDAAQFALLAATLALIVALFSLITWIARAGEVVKFVSETVLVGFKAGVAFHLASTQLPKLCGFKGISGTFWERAAHFATHLGDTHLMSFAFGGGALVLLFAGKFLLPNRPTAVVVLVAAIVVASQIDAAGQGVKVLGEVPQGLPVPSVPAISWGLANDLLPLAAACFLLAAVETAAIGRMFAKKHGYRLDGNQEFLALAGCNLASSLGGGYPTSGGMSQSLVNEGGGARSPLSGLCAAGFLLVTVLFLSGMLSDLPQPVLAAVVLVAVSGLIKVSALRKIWRFHRAEFAVAMASLLGVLCAGLLNGVLIGAVISVLVILRRGARPRTAELGRVPHSGYFADVRLAPENERPPGALVFRVESPLVYFNVEHVRDRLEVFLARREDPVRRVVFLMSSVPGVDLAGAEMLIEIHRDLRARGIELRLAELRDTVRDMLQHAGYEEAAGPLVIHQRIQTILEEAPRETPREGPAAPAPGGTA